MDLIGALTGQLGIDNQKAEGLAGTLLGAIKDQVAEKIGSAEASQIGEAIPELGGWAQKAKESGEESGGGGLFGAATSALGGGGGLLGSLAGGGDLLSMVSKFNLKEGAIGIIAPLVMSFLKDRLPAGLLAKLEGGLPIVKALLTSGSGGGGGGIAGALGGLFKG